MNSILFNETKLFLNTYYWVPAILIEDSLIRPLDLLTAGTQSFQMLLKNQNYFGLIVAVNSQ